MAQDAPILSVDALVAAARAATGLDDLWPDALGGGSARQGLETLVRSMEREAGLTQESARAAFEQLSGLLVTRLQMARDRREQPAIAAERVERPLIVIGMPRSGTTLLHALLAADPANRAPRAWERYFPSPPPANTAPDDARRRQADDIIRSFTATYPGLLSAHPYWDALGDATVECEDFTQLVFASIYFGGFSHVPGYTAWLLSTDGAPMYRFHRSFLQHRQFGGSVLRWVLKGTAHAYFIDALHAEYPDAVLIWPHRDLTEQIVSTMELTAVIRNAHDAASRSLVTADMLEQVDRGLRRAVASPLLDVPEVVCHISYRQLVDDPVATVREIYGQYHIPYAGDFERRMRSWLADPANKPDRHGKFTYDMASFGLSEGGLSERYEFYRERVQALGIDI